MSGGTLPFSCAKIAPAGKEQCSLFLRPERERIGSSSPAAGEARHHAHQPAQYFRSHGPDPTDIQPCTDHLRHRQGRKGPARGGVLDGAEAVICAPCAEPARAASQERGPARLGAPAPQSDRRRASVERAHLRPALCRTWLQRQVPDRPAHQRLCFLCAASRHRHGADEENAKPQRRATSGPAGSRRADYRVMRFR